MNRITRVDGWWDGPLSGRCVYDGREYEFRCFNVGGWIPTEDDSDACLVPRTFTLHDSSGNKRGAVFDDELYFNRDEYYGPRQ